LPGGSVRAGPLDANSSVVCRGARARAAAALGSYSSYIYNLNFIIYSV